MQWVDEEIPNDCVRRVLTSFPGDAELRNSGKWPVERDKDCILQAVRENKIVGVKAQPGSGKTMCIPEYLLEVQTQVVRRAGKAVLVVQPACYAAAKIANAFVSLRGRDRRHIHVRTGTHEEQFNSYTHKFSFITYGILWKWNRGDPGF